MSEQPKISDEAVEACCQAYYDWWNLPAVGPNRAVVRRRIQTALAAAYPLLRQQWEAERNVPYGSDHVSVERDWLLAEAPDEVRERFFRARSEIPDA